MVLPAMVHPIVVGLMGSNGHLKKLWVLRGLARLVSEDE